MVNIYEFLQLAVELLAVLVTGYFALTMWRRRAEPTARPLLGFAAIVFVGVLGHLAVVHPTPIKRALTALAWAEAGGPLWIDLGAVVVMLAGGFWFLFTLQYTGRSGRLLPLMATGIGCFWLFIVGLALFGDLSPPSESLAKTSVEAALFVGAYLTGVLMVVGAMLVLTTSLRRNAVRVREALALGGGASLLAFIPFVSDIFLAPDAIPVMVSVSSGLFVLSVHRYPAFEAPPVARIAGRDRLIEEIDDAFVVVDLEGRIRDLNPAGEHYFDTDSEAVLGESLDALLPSAIDPEEVAATQEPVQLRTLSGATLAVTANRITDARDRSFGHLLVFRDVTERQRREHRLGVLNQLLTGAVSNRMGAIAEAVEPLAETAGTDGTATPNMAPADVAGEIRVETTRLLELVAWTREIERALATEGSGPVEVGPLVTQVADDVTNAEELVPDITVDEAVSVAAVDAGVLETVLEILLTDTLERGTNTVDIEVVDSESGPEIHALDDGAARDAVDATDGVIGAGDARSRSELVVEMVRLTAQHVGGDVRMQASERDGRRVVLELPGADEPNPDENAPVQVGGRRSDSTGDREGVR